MVNQEELAICRRRGHVFEGKLRPDNGFYQCEKCRIWVRDVITREEREDDPPEEEQSAESTSRRLLMEMKRRIDAQHGEDKA
jgi:hypothetical protein